MVVIIVLTLIYIVLSVFSIIDIYKNKGDIYGVRLLSAWWIGFTITAIILWLMSDA